MNSQWFAFAGILLIVIGALALFKHRFKYPFQWLLFKHFERKVKRLGEQSRLPNDHIDNAIKRFDARSQFTALAMAERSRRSDPFSERRKVLLKSECRGAIDAALKYDDLKEGEVSSWEYAYGLRSFEDRRNN